MESIRLLIVDDHVLIRNGLRLLLEKDESLQVVAEAEEGGGSHPSCDQVSTGCHFTGRDDAWWIRRIRH